jgi:PadR family transcriptional regulator PadR
MNRFERELRRGVLELVLLSLLQKEDMYGYQLVAHIASHDQLFEIKEGTLYPILYRMEDRHWIESYRDSPDRGVPRKYYKLTDEGQKACGELKAQWERFRDAIDRLLSGKE